MRRIKELTSDNDNRKVSIWDKLVPEIKTLYPSNKRLAIEKAIEKISVFDKNLFYPLIGEIFTDLGLNIAVTRDGDTNNRADAIIIHETNSIPIEIKSPTEVQYVNIKSVRQALENKIVMMSRCFHPTTTETTSLAVAMLYPETRSGIVELIEDFFKTYNFNIGYINIKDLLQIHWEVQFEKRTFDIKDIYILRGQFILNK